MNRPVDVADSDAAEAQESATGVASLVGRLVLPVVLIVVGIVGYSWLSKKPPPPPVPKPKAKSVEARVKALERVDYEIRVRSQGAIRSHSQVSLTAQVTGRVQTIHPEFEEGAFFKKGDVLLELDPVDFEVALVSAEAQLAQARFNLIQERTRATKAKLDWEDLGYDEEPSEMVLRIPHVELAEKQVAQALAQKMNALRSLERAKVRAPFDGRVLTRSVGIGQTIGGSAPLGEIFAIDYSEVRLPVSTRFLPDLSLPEDITDPPLHIRLTDALSETSTLEWDAKILRTEGALNAGTLELFAIARIEDPFGRTSKKVPLRVGQPVATYIPGRILEDVFVIPRDAVVGLNRIRVVDPETLTLGTAFVNQLWSDDENLIFRDPKIKDGMLLVLTRLVFAPDGGKVVIVEDEVPADPKGTTTKPADARGEKAASTKK